jgi:hypothetical protein
MQNVADSLRALQNDADGYVPRKISNMLPRSASISPASKCRLAMPTLTAQFPANPPASDHPGGAGASGQARRHSGVVLGGGWLERAWSA